ncbi:MAG: DUF4270 family protein [Crocinitomicaceae bacterium]
MTKKNTNKTWRKVFKLSATFLIAFFIFSSCKKEISSVGTDINPNGLNIVTQDTFTVVTKTVITDSLTTDETSINLLGGFNDPELGKVDCGIVTQLRLSSEGPNFGDPNDINVDSVVLSFVYDGKLHYGDITDLSFEILQITELLDKEEDYYRYTPISTTGSNLIIPGTESQKAKPQSIVVLADDTLVPMLRFNLKTSFGEDLINNADQMSTNANFTNFFRGIYVRATNLNNFDENEGTVLYFSLLDALSNMVLYYEIDGEKKKFTFNINSNCARFNKLDFDYSGTPLAQSINSEAAAQEKIYFQGSHIRPEFHFPFLDKFKDERNIVLNRAELVVPVQNFENSPFDPSTALFIGRISTNFLITLTYDYSNGSTVDYDPIANEFRFNLTRDLQRVISGEIENTGYRIFTTSFFGSTIERIIFSGPNSITKDKTKLVLTYTEY